MNKPLLLSLAAATLLGTNLNAESMYDRIQAMELEMNKMRQELTTLKAEKADSEDEEESDVTSEDDEESEDEEEGEDADSDEEGDDEEEEEEEMDVEEEIRDMQEEITELNKATNGNKLKFGVDYRFAIENMQYDMANKTEAKNDAFMTNRFWMNMSWSATKNLSFKGQLAYNKAFGQRSAVPTDPANPDNLYESFDWIANENAYDDVIRLRSAYFLYKDGQFLGANIPWTFSIGRRPSTNGHLVNLRDDDQAASPMGHSINVEFDGLSSKFSLEKLTGADGMYVKLCAGRGMSNAQPMFSENGTPYATNDDANPDIDLIGLIFTPYDNGQYAINTQYYYANNLIDMVNPMNPSLGFDTVGGMHSVTANITVNGIGEDNEFLEDSIFFISGAMSKSDPKDDKAMFNAMEPGESQTGHSVWVGLQTPSLISEDGRMGFEWNQGSEYWRSITYGEDTNIGSKLAARGQAYEAYFTEYLVEDILSLQLRYTYIDYEYTGSNGFFGGTTGNSMEIAETMNTPMGDIAGVTVDKAQDIRFYLRYKY